MVQGSKVYSFPELVEMIRASRNGQIKLANNTIAHFTDNERIAIRLHFTDIIIINPDDTYELYTNGYTTKTTRDRLNGFSPAKVIQKDYSFYLLKNPSDGSNKANMIPFEEGITVDRFGNVNSATA